MNPKGAAPDVVKVSVAIIAYNHEAFIGQAIDSVLMQQTDFEYEIVIGEDCSTDRTRDIVRDYGDRHRDRIRLLLADRNRGGHANFVSSLMACRGSYIATLDGDDYWTAPHKLQKQADFLDGHSECSYCFHNVETVWEDSSSKPRAWFSTPLKATLGLEDILAWNFSATCSVMFRRGLFGEFPDWYFKLSMGDWPLHVLNAQHGSTGYDHEVMAVYRRHANGTWSSHGRLATIPGEIKFLRTINRHLKYEFNRQIRLGLASRYYDMAIEFADAGDRMQRELNLLKSIWLAPLDHPVPKRQLLALASPSLADWLRRWRQHFTS